ncbi:MAG TPA: response regulator [Anaerolineales bacterium]|nr:response regulator [Anaerolineales bacterium]
MKRVYLADSQSDERLAFRLILQDLNMLIVGEAADWPTALAQAPATSPDMLMVDWGLVAAGAGADLSELRMACPAAVVIVLISHLSAREQAALSAGADAFISKGETSDRVAERLREAVASIRSR